ncbi:cytochrome c biogenesis protein CcdA [Methanolobus sp. ZRKC3]|uniref:cytochrome c biogenesis CcdA family protein n=1 Tax=Methanolobus sp. ZRKC3 TaxID=3125786 RepID=UPI0032450E0C
MSILANVLQSFILGLLTPLTAVCVLPLYPGFLAYLSNQISKAQETGEENRKVLILFGFIVTAGVITFMLLLGLVFTTILKVSLTKVIGIVSPVAFAILGVIGVILVLDIDIGKYLPTGKAPTSSNPFIDAFLYGFFFGAIVIPCNPAFIAAFFTLSLSGAASFITNMLNFLFFGLGLGAPLLAFSLLSGASSASVIGFLVNNKKRINVITGSIMIVVSIYYLLFVFRIFG